MNARQKTNEKKNLFSFNAHRKKKFFDSDRKDEFIPLVSQLTPTIAHAKNKMLVSGFSLVGTPFETKTDNQLEIYKNKIDKKLNKKKK